nr:BatD family protein [uncultured Desulfobulbus sp.]
MFTRQLLRITSLLLILLCALNGYGAASQQQVQLQAELDRTSITENESVGLKVTLVGSREQSEPDFSALETDFTILSRQNSSTMQIVQGEINQSTLWSLMLMPKQTGSLPIPAFQLTTKEGVIHSQPLTLEVRPSGASTGTNQRLSTSQDFLIEVAAEPETPYVDSQVIYTIRVYIGRRIVQASLTEPQAENATLTKLGDDVQYLQEKDGRQYKVIERRYVVFPEEPGTITISPVRFDARLGGGSSSIFDSFGMNGPVKSIRSESLRLDVQPPKQEVAGVWLPASDVRLQGSWAGNTHEVKVGDPVTLHLIVEANGQLCTRLPEPALKEIQNVRMYPDQATRSNQEGKTGITGRLEKRIALIFSSPGTYTLPTLSIPWWNTRTQQPEVAKLEGLSLTVLPAAGGQQAPPQGASIQGKTPITEPEAAEAIKAPSLQSGKSASQGEGNGAEGDIFLWQGLAAFFAVAWISTLVVWGYRSRLGGRKAEIKRTPVPGTGPSAMNDAAEKLLRKACTEHDSGLAVQALQSLLPENYRQQASGGPLQEAIDALYRARYGDQGSSSRNGGAQSLPSWNGRALWAAWQEFQRERSRPSKQSSQELKPLWCKAKPALRNSKR